MKIRKGDTVMVISGKDQTKQGRVERVLPGSNRVLVEGINVITRHVKSAPGLRQGGRITQESPIHISNVMVVCSRCNQPVRVGFRRLDDGTKVRVCQLCKETIT